ncbi:MAG: protein translocase subunit SecF [bacterium]|jgi:preprotein translocase subunit SecF
MELFRQTNIDFVGKMKLAFVISLGLTVATIVTLIVQGGPKWGLDFRGGAVITVKFNSEPPIQQLRSVLDDSIEGEVTVQQLAGNEVMIGTELQSEEALEQSRVTITRVLLDRFGDSTGKLVFNVASTQQLVDRLRDPLQRAGVPMSEADLQSLASGMTRFRDQQRSGLISDFDELSAVPGVNQQVLSVLRQEAVPGAFSIRSVDIVGPKASADLRSQALMATLYALGGMLVYIAFRFEWAAGVAAVIACAHDTLITIGVLAWTGREITLTVIAALLTLIGYSMNDTIVVFDRVRENLKLRSRDRFYDLVNKSVNQTLSRTMLTAGPTLLAVIAIYFLGGPVLNSFAFTLIIGILIGTYSSIYVASSLVVVWQAYFDRRKRPSAATSNSAPVSKAKEGSRKVTSR